MIVVVQKERKAKGTSLTNGKLEGDLWVKFQAGDEEAFAKIYQSYVQVLYNYGKNISDDEALVEDCIHALFLDMWKNRANLSQPTSIRFYLYASIKRRILKEIAKQKEHVMDESSMLESVVKESSMCMEEYLIHNQDRALQRTQLKKGLLQLSCNQRKAILLKFYKNLSFQEISEVMEMSIDNVYKLVGRGLSSLRKTVQYTGAL